VLPSGQAWAAGVRAGMVLATVGGRRAATWEGAAALLEASRARGEANCAVLFEAEERKLLKNSNGMDLW
jgi:hypothetical protein